MGKKLSQTVKRYTTRGDRHDNLRNLANEGEESLEFQLVFIFLFELYVNTVDYTICLHFMRKTCSAGFVCFSLQEHGNRYLEYLVFVESERSVFLFWSVFVSHMNTPSW